MHKGYASNKKNVEKQVHRIYYNSSLGNTDSVFPFHSVPSASDLKSFRVNLALCKEKLQKQFQKCRDYLKEVSNSKSVTNSNGILEEVIMENMGKKSKRYLMKELHKMGLKMKEAEGEKETIIVVDLSPISQDQEALHTFMTFINKVQQKGKSQKKLPKVVVSSSKLSTHRKETKTHRNSQKNKINQGNRQSEIECLANRYILKKTESSVNCDKIDKHLKKNAHGFEPGRSLCFNEYYLKNWPSKDIKTNEIKWKYPFEKSKAKVVKKILPGQCYQSHPLSEDVLKKKLSTKVVNNNTEYVPKIEPKLNTKDNIPHNLFRSNPPTSVTKMSNQNKKQRKKKDRKHGISRLLKFFNFLTGNKKYLSNQGNIIPSTDIQVFTMQINDGQEEVHTEEVADELRKAHQGKGRRISFNTSLEDQETNSIGSFGNESVARSSFSKKRVSLTPSIKSILDEKPVQIWGKKVCIDSKKELKLAMKNYPEGVDFTTTGCNILMEEKPHHEIEQILDQQTEIKGMIESIQNRLKYYERENIMSSTENAQQGTTSSFRETWSKNATKSPISESTYEYDQTNSTFCDSMTNLPHNSCWCPHIFDKLKYFCQSMHSDDAFENKVHHELRDQKREIIRLNKLLHEHLMDN